MTSRANATRRTLGHGRAHRGYAVLWCLITLMLFLTFGAFAIELGWLRSAEVQGQTAAEAAALAAAGSLHQGRGAAATSASDIAGLNQGPNGDIVLLATENNSNEDLTFGRWDAETGTFVEGLFIPDAARARIRFVDNHPNGPVRLLFSNILPTDQTNMVREVIAHRKPKLPAPLSALIRNSIQPGSVDLRDTTLTVNGEMEVRSGSSDAFVCLDGSSVTATLIDNRGGFSVDSDDSIRSYIADEDQPVEPAPVNVAPESLVTQAEVIDLPGSYQLPPGYYPNGLEASEGQYILNDGIYYFDGPGIALSGAASISGENVLIVIGGSSTLRVDGADMQISATDQVGTFSNPERIALFTNQDSSDALEIIGSAAVTVEGVFMAPNSNLSCVNSSLAATTLVCGTLRGRSGASIDLGPATPHPVSISIVD